MKNINLLSLCFLLISPCFLHAQDTGPRTHQLSLNLLGLLQSRNVNFLYQRHKEKGSLRLGLNGVLSLSKSESENTFLDRPDYAFNVGFRGGWAFHKMVKEFDLYSGADAVLDLWFDQNILYQRSSNSSFLVENRSVTRMIRPRLALEPFLGVNYAINEMFSLGFELRGSIGYALGFNQELRERSITDKSTNDVEIEISETGPIPTHLFNLSLVNFSAIWISIHL